MLPPSIDYTDKDFDALRERLIALVRSVFPDWSDFSVASFGNVLLEMFAFIGDVLGFYLEAQSRESRLATLTPHFTAEGTQRDLWLESLQHSIADDGIFLQGDDSALTEHDASGQQGSRRRHGSAQRFVHGEPLTHGRRIGPAQERQQFGVQGDVYRRAAPVAGEYPVDGDRRPQTLRISAEVSETRSRKRQ